MIVVIDYGIGNIFSILNSFRMIGVDVILSSERDKIEEADKIILPGVGFFREAMNNIERFGLRELLIEKSRKKVPILGICLGMQILFEESEESPGVRGLGLLKGKVKRLPPLERIPHIGWNTVSMKNPFFENERYFYFAHSYYCAPEKKETILGETSYGILFPSIVREENIWGVQFHPEKSGKNGIEFLKRWLDANNTSY